MKITVKNLQNKDVRDMDLSEEIFNCPYKEHLIHLAIQAYLASRRSGTHKVKNRSEVSGSGRKLWRQKGTGRARVGSLRSPLWRKGGTVHGPKPRSYGKQLTVREKKVALCSALSRKLAQEGILVVDNLALESHKTQDLARILSGLGVNSKALIIDKHGNLNLDLAARNNPQVKTVDPLGVNVYDVVDRRHVVFSIEALERLMEVLT